MFSVVIPLYNKSFLIKRAIDSVLSQTYQDFEIIVVDDGSKDYGAEYVKEYTDVRIKYYYKDNGGVSSARNYGIEKAHGEWIIFLDADDVFEPNAFEYFIQLINRYPETKVFIGQQETQKNVSALESKRTHFPLLMMWLNRFYPRPGAVLIHKDLLHKIGGFDERQSFYEDQEYGLRTLLCGSVVYFNKQTVKYNQDGTGLSGSSHPIEKEMAYYIPEYVETSSFWHKALLYENLEAEIYWWQLHGVEEIAKFYQDMQKNYFGRIYKVLHWVRQKLVRKGII